jgi:hypothetical protein
MFKEKINRTKPHEQASRTRGECNTGKAEKVGGSWANAGINTVVQDYLLYSQKATFSS